MADVAAPAQVPPDQQELEGHGERRGVTSGRRARRLGRGAPELVGALHGAGRVALPGAGALALRRSGARVRRHRRQQGHDPQHPQLRLPQPPYPTVTNIMTETESEEATSTNHPCLIHAS